MFCCCDKPHQGIPFTSKYHQNTSTGNNYNDSEDASCFDKTEISQMYCKKQESASLYGRDNLIKRCKDWLPENIMLLRV